MFYFGGSNNFIENSDDVVITPLELDAHGDLSYGLDGGVFFLGNLNFVTLTVQEGPSFFSYTSPSNNYEAVVTVVARSSIYVSGCSSISITVDDEFRGYVPDYGDDEFHEVSAVVPAGSTLEIAQEGNCWIDIHKIVVKYGALQRVSLFSSLFVFPSSRRPPTSVRICVRLVFSVHT